MITYIAYFKLVRKFNIHKNIAMLYEWIAQYYFMPEPQISLCMLNRLTNIIEMINSVKPEIREPEHYCSFHKITHRKISPIRSSI